MSENGQAAAPAAKPDNVRPGYVDEGEAAIE